MDSWPSPAVPRLPAHPDTRAAAAVRHGPGRCSRHLAAGPAARLYVCGITPYDATHLGHAATYLAFDTDQAGLARRGLSRVHYVQNVTDVDDPLLERATRTGENWMALAEREIAAVPRGHDRAAGARPR